MNRIPRSFKYITATALCGNCEGHTFRITKNVYDGYHAEDMQTGKIWRTFISHLRNEHFYHIDHIEKGD